LNDAGFDMRQTLREDMEIPWIEENIKRFIWKPVMRSITDKESTTELTSKEIDKIYDIINRHTAEKFGISIQFPAEDNIE
jgi:hypothetical protein